MKIGLTGRIACGKSTVSNYLRKKGFKIVDCDALGHYILKNDEGVKTSVRDTFGTHVFKGKEIYRPALGMIVFHNAAARRALEKIMRPRVHKYVYASLLEGGNQVVDCFEIIGSPIQPLLDETWVVLCPPRMQLSRLMARNNLTKLDAQARIAAHPISELEMVRGADRLLNNHGNIANLEGQVKQHLRTLKHLRKL